MTVPESPAPQRLANTVGARIRAHRTELGWTLDQLALASGVSRRQIVNIEHGAVNPSIGTLLRLATAFDISLAAVISNAPQGGPQHSEPTVLWFGDSGGTGTLLASTEAPEIIELWAWRMMPGETHHSEPHSSGTREIIHVTEGAVQMQIGDDTHDLEAGDSLVFPGDVSHAYRANSGATTVFTLAVHQPGVTHEH